MKRYLEKNGKSDIHPELYVNYINNAVFGGYIWWLKERKPISKEDLIEQLFKLVMID